ncbi:cobalt ECF transporter T component CbiQ [Kineosporia sp. NBRC 101677]|uniref:cobalt ECF transporter T component CbiQ n=1 Tax=Kineosporia sp. NBRC 101677 TaxID=3032197 RepID=UPI0024A09B9E|nr:cobalt ECF transporter T component CbiQ [Kineosporia sp. NBRC 101677]GLY17752.1 cobalt ECF transporter T component CbiQ [Kineosporia sp. NBRC 101677]
MSGGHAHQGLLVPGTSVLHRLPAHVKLVAALFSVLAIVAAPGSQFWAFGVFAGVIALLAAVARIPPGLIARRLLIELPFVVFALLLPFVAAGERTEVLGVPMSIEGLWSAWELVATATLGLAVSVLLAATTGLREILTGLERLRMPTLIVQIMSFMIRYADVVADELRRMRIARESRGFVARDIRQWPVLGRSAGALFVRCFERGERVHLAMLSRGYDGGMPGTDGPGASSVVWATGLSLPLLFTVVTAVAVLTGGAR